MGGVQRWGEGGRGSRGDWCTQLSHLLQLQQLDQRLDQQALASGLRATGTSLGSILGPAPCTRLAPHAPSPGPFLRWARVGVTSGLGVGLWTP